MGNNDPSLDLSLDQYIEAAITRNTESYDDAEWQTPLWHFVRLMKGYRSLRGMDAAGALRNVEAELRDLGRTWTKDFPCESDDEARTEFLDAWPKVRYLAGYGPVEYAFDHSSSNVVVTERSKRAPDLYAPYNRFVCFAIALQEAMDKKPILLPCHKLSKLFGVAPMTISRWRRWAILDGVLNVDSEHRHNPKGIGEATKFRVNLIEWSDVLQWLADGRQAEREMQGERELEAIERKADATRSLEEDEAA